MSLSLSLTSGVQVRDWKERPHNAGEGTDAVKRVRLRSKWRGKIINVRVEAVEGGLGGPLLIWPPD